MLGRLTGTWESLHGFHFAHREASKREHRKLACGLTIHYYAYHERAKDRQIKTIGTPHARGIAHRCRVALGSWLFNLAALQVLRLRLSRAASHPGTTSLARVDGQA